MSDIKFYEDDGTPILRDSDSYTPEERSTWGVTADQAIAQLNAGIVKKWDRDTTQERIVSHCRALVMEGNSREDTLKYLIDYNRLGSEIPQWWEGRLKELVEFWEPYFAEQDREYDLIKQCSPQEWDCPSAAEIVDRKMEPRLPLVTENGQPVFYEKSVNQIFSWRGVGKSLFAMGIANLMAGGGNMIRWKCGEPRRVLYLDGELPEEQSQERLREFVSEENRARVHLISPDLLKLGQGINLFETSHAAAIRRMVEDKNIGVLILDSQAMLMPGDPLKTDFNDNRNRLLHQYRLMGLCVIEIHHGGKSREQRGSSRNDDILDVQIRLAEPKDWEHGDGLQFEMEYKKVRHAAKLESNYSVSFVDGAWKQIQSDLDAGVADLLSQGKSSRAIARELDVSQSRVSRIQRKLEAAGLLKLNEKLKPREEKCKAR